MLQYTEMRAHHVSILTLLSLMQPPFPPGSQGVAAIEYNANLYSLLGLEPGTSLSYNNVSAHTAVNLPRAHFVRRIELHGSKGPASTWNH